MRRVINIYTHTNTHRELFAEKICAENKNDRPKFTNCQISIYVYIYCKCQLSNILHMVYEVETYF